MEDKQLEKLKKELVNALSEADPIYRTITTERNSEKIVNALDKLIDYKIKQAIGK